MKLLLGTRNPEKIRDYKKYLVHANLKLVTLPELGIWEEPLEIGETYKDNALQKARFYAEKTEYPTLGEDGGFEVEALDNRPGIESRRWVGPGGTDEDRINKVLDLLGKEKNRKAKLTFTAVVYFPNERDYVEVSSSVEGVVPEKASPVVRKNFAYRSLLFFPQYNRYYVELSEEEEQEIDHRKKACKELLLKLEPYISS